MSNNLNDKNEKEFKKSVSPFVSFAKEKIAENVINYAENAAIDIIYRKIHR